MRPTNPVELWQDFRFYPLQSTFKMLITKKKNKLLANIIADKQASLEKAIKGFKRIVDKEGIIMSITKSLQLFLIAQTRLYGVSW
jgi:hypothetical protein